MNMVVAMDRDTGFSPESVELADAIGVDLSRRIAQLLRQAKKLAHETALRESRRVVSREDIKAAFNSIIFAFAKDLQEHPICKLFDHPRAIGLEERTLSSAGATKLDEMLSGNGPRLRIQAHDLQSG